ncbi:MAG: 50S ribosomal protein L25 [Nitrospira sp.]|nr:50S ribosomal protein L25 [Nitrospira sp.]
MQRIEMTAELREKSGKGVARSVRRSGKIPGVLYGEGKSLLLILDPVNLTKVLHSGAGENALITLKIQGMQEKASSTKKSDAERLTILRDCQVDPITGKLLHADLFEVSLNKPIRVRVHIEIIGGVPEGVKEGGVLQHQMREVEIECLPMSIPDRFEVDASALKIGEAIHVRDLNVGEGVRFLNQPDQVVVSVAAPISEAKLEELLTATAKEVKEPEVIARGKEEEGEEQAKPEAKAAAEPAAAGKAKKEEGKEEKKEAKPKG